MIGLFGFTIWIWYSHSQIRYVQVNTVTITPVSYLIINSFLKFSHVITLRWPIYYSISSTWLMMMLKKIMLIGDIDDAIFWWIKIYCSISLALKRFRDLCTLVTTLSAVNPEYFLRPKFNHTLRVTHTLTTLIENGLRPHLMSNSL